MVPNPQESGGSRPGFEAFVGVGANLDPEKNILAALPDIQSGLQVLATSRFYRNPAFPPDRRELPPFVNGVLKVRTNQTPWDLKYRVLRSIEGKYRRTRTEDRYGPRTLDLDLLVYENLEIQSEWLNLPHPDISVHPFLVVPLAELLPDFRLPESSLCLKELVENLDAGSMVYLESFTHQVRRTLGLA
jgi:2-amino-4-hydroxy-6-hydroxymethyldihydropteridine diphosphokinase